VGKSNNSRFNIKLPFYLALVLALGIFIGALFFSSNPKGDIGSSYKKYAEILSYIHNDYVDTVDINTLVDYSISSMLDKLDPHTAYIPKAKTELADSQLEGGFEGIGIEFNIFRDTLIVVSPVVGGPSEAAGLLSGDKIVKVNDSIITGTILSNASVFSLLRGEKGSSVKLSVKRGKQPNLIDYTVIRDKIPTYSLEVAYMLDEHTGYMKISRFSETTYEEFKKGLEALKKEGMQKLVLDLRDNPGGYMKMATKIADEFLSGSKLIIYTKGKEAKYDQKIYANQAGNFEKGALIVLVNEGSASASEILTGALQDNDRALIVGRRSFGKGLVQIPITLEDQSELRLTIARYYSPSGRCIQKPYADTPDDYNTDLLRRYKHGEFFHADSIRFNDSLKYTTLHGRTVYGGGGIMPDIFVARDTSGFTSYLLKLYGKNIIREYALTYYANHKETLEKSDLKTYKEKFAVSDALLKQFQDFAAQNGVKLNKKQFDKSKKIIRSDIKAYLARSIWGNKGFYSVFNESDITLLHALEHWKEAETLAEN